MSLYDPLIHVITKGTQTSPILENPLSHFLRFGGPCLKALSASAGFWRAAAHGESASGLEGLRAMKVWVVPIHERIFRGFRIAWT